MLSRIGQFTGSDTIIKLKWIALVVVPAFGIFYETVGVSQGWWNPEGVSIFCKAATIFFGAIIFADKTSITKAIESNDAGSDIVFDTDGDDAITENEEEEASIEVETFPENPEKK